MNILVISGFLGAGKTTFIQELIRRTGTDAVIYENEYGEADIDARRLRADSDLKVWESVENCICCSGKQDFATSVLTISSTLDPEYLIVEPTGVARLGSVIGNLGQVEWERISLLAPVTIVDALSWEEQRRRFPEIFDDQVGNAASVVISKLGAAGDADPLAALIGGLNPTAELISSPYAAISDEWWLSLLSRNLPGSPSDTEPTLSSQDRVDVETMALNHTMLPTPNHLFWILDALSAGVFGRLDRAKGTLPCGNQWLRFDLVERMWAVTGGEEAEEARCTFIGSDLYRSGLREVFVPALWREEAEIHHHHDHGHDEGDHGHREDEELS